MKWVIKKNEDLLMEKGSLLKRGRERWGPAMGWC